MRAYKAFNIGLKCRGYQFVEGKNVTDQANCVRNGFHCAENPVDCLTYYPNVKTSEYWVVDAGGDIDEDSIDSKIACTELTTIKKLSIYEYMVHCLAWLAKYPESRNHSKIEHNNGSASQGYAIVIGRNPIAKGKEGDVLALLQTNRVGKAIAIGIHTVGDANFKPDTYYDVMGQEREYV